MKVAPKKKRLLKVFIGVYLLVAATWAVHAVVTSKGTDKVYTLGRGVKGLYLTKPLEVRTLKGARLDEHLKRVLERAGVGAVTLEDGRPVPIRDAVGETLQTVVFPEGTHITDDLWNDVLSTERMIHPETKISVKGTGDILGYSLDLVLVVMNFFGLLCILYVFLWDPILEMLDRRAETIRSDLQGARQKREDARALYGKYSTLMDGAKKQREALLTTGQRDGEAERERIIARAREEAEKVLQRAREEIGGEVEKARRELGREVAGLSTQIAAEILRREIRPQDHDALVQEFLKKIDGPGTEDT